MGKEKTQENVEHVSSGRVGRKSPTVRHRLCRCLWRFVLTVVLLLVVIALGVGYTTSRTAFCGSCHIMNSYHESWQESGHAEAGVTCVACHYLPDENDTIRARFQGLGQFISCLGIDEGAVQKTAFVSDQNCTASGCHSLEGDGDEEWLTKRIEFASYTRQDGSEATVPFVHETHFSEENRLDGQEKQCGICHRHETEENHIEVSAKTCNLCHFKNTALNEERAKCSLCHELPEKPLVAGASADEGAVTHKTLEERGVACSSCHLRHVRGTGRVRIQRCLECHDNDESIVEFSTEGELVHDTHISAQAAHCSSCHEPVEHGQASEDYDHFDAALSNCKACHVQPHRSNVLLLSGTGGKGMDDPMPIKHYSMSMTCSACHIEDVVDDMGRTKKVATPGVCANCHSQKEGALIEKWKSDVAEIMEEAVEYEQEAVAALAQARGKVSGETIEKAEQLLSDGQENLRIVNAGGGVHNKKFSALLLDIAIEFFEDAIAELEVE